MKDRETNPGDRRDIGEASASIGEGLGDTRDDALFPKGRDRIAEGVGGLGGAAAGAAIGAAAGPIGAVVGGLAGAVGGWWAGKEIAEATTSFGEKEDAYYRSHFERDPNRMADRSYADVRPFYVLGHIAACNPENRNRPFAEVASELEQAWSEHAADERRAAWAHGHSFAEIAYERRKLTTQVPGAANIAAGSVESPGGQGL